ncbi:S8 family peptidase [Acetobacterium woodii]|uniref:Peptidase S8/S53 domain-containing protein n=1 Tax=Acetobacterium woodii (strain ATCC 29683 / DSM 1030 / JCM 2381 / KCTC 1655 / WB1) TaxID=931626 RepID=H6LDU5_ACEWD|nr:S8 family peptidase [Acetobacterium woodii]AFA47988.1 hypothetical protein Awo_c12040 [Acetobacterium woodii DSM 1030]
MVKRELLPIKFFSKRDSDSLRTEGGPSQDPSWILNDENLIIRSNMLDDNMTEIDELFNKRKIDYLPLVIEVDIFEKAIAKTHRNAIASLFSMKNGSEIIGMISETKLLVKVNSKEHARKIRSKIKDTEKYKHALSAVENIEPFSPIIKKKKDVKTYKIVLVNYENYELNLSAERNFEFSCNQKGVAFNKTVYTEDLTVYKIKNADLDVLFDDENISEIIFEITPMPFIHASLDALESPNDFQIQVPDDKKSYPIVGVLDNGIECIPHLEPWLLKDKYSAYPPDLVAKNHGTAVASIIVYGDALENKELTGNSGCFIFDATVFPDLTKEDLEEDELVANINEAISQNCLNIKIWNLSGGFQQEIEDEKFSDFAMALDSIQDRYGVVICKSAGNCKNFKTGKPKGKINIGADSVRALTVGSIAQSKAESDYSEINYPSPFTKIGRGPGNIIKPELVHFGGNAGKNTVSGVKVINVNGELSESAGTSFATPRIADLLSGLENEIADEFDPLLVKALAIHSSNYPKNVKMTQENKVKEMGFGLPKPINEILYNNPNEVTLILKDTLEKSKFIDILDFPMPDCLVFDGKFTGQIIATLVYNPYLKTAQANEYCQSNIDIYMGTFDEKTQRDTSKFNVLNPIGRKGSHNLLNPSCYSATKLKAMNDSFSKSERFLTKCGSKFYPIKKYAVDLKDLTDGNKEKYLGSGRKWFLKIEGLYRSSIEDEAIKNNEILSQDFCLVLTIKHPNPDVPVYNEVVKGLAENNFWHQNINLRNQINVVLHN